MVLEGKFSWVTSSQLGQWHMLNRPMCEILNFELFFSLKISLNNSFHNWALSYLLKNKKQPMPSCQLAFPGKLIFSEKTSHLQSSRRIVCEK
jgi:hypothetical protein